MVLGCPDQRLPSEHGTLSAYHSADPTGSLPPRPPQGARGFLSSILPEETPDMLPVLFPTLLASLPTGPGAALAITAATLTYVLTQREIDAKLSIR